MLLYALMQFQTDKTKAIKTKLNLIITIAVSQDAVIKIIHYSQGNRHIKKKTIQAEHFG